MLVLTRRIGETLNIYVGETKVRVKVLNWAGNQIKLGIDAPKEVKIIRQEIDQPRRDDNEQ